MKSKMNKPKALPRGKMLGLKLEPQEGPWAGRKVFIPVGGTMKFRVGPFHGHYDHNGEWHDAGRS